MDRRQFNHSLSALAAAGFAKRAASESVVRQPRTVVYNSIGDTLTHHDLEVESGTLTQRATVQTPSIVQYGWPHPSNRYVYVCTTDSGRGSRTITGASHFLCAFRVAEDGSLLAHGEPRVLRQRPIHTSVDRSGQFLLTAYNAPPHLSVHHINPDGTLGAEIEQPANLDLGIFCHQIQSMPSNRSVVMATRGNNPSTEKPKGDPGALKIFRFEDGHLLPLDNITVGGQGGYGYGPRHLDFHPTRPWAYVLVELQNQLHMHRLVGDSLEAKPSFIKQSTQFAPRSDVLQDPGAIHVHPRGHVLYASNRINAATHSVGAFPFVGGENNIAVFRINPTTGEPTPIQFADPHGFHVRAFTIDPSGRILIAAMLAAMSVRDGNQQRIVPAGLSVFRIADDGRLDFLRRYDVELPPGVQQMWVRAMPLGL